MKKTKAEILEKVRPQLADLELKRKELSKANTGNLNMILLTGLVGIILVVTLAVVISSKGILLFIPVIFFLSIVFLGIQGNYLPGQENYSQSLGDIIVKGIDPTWTYQAEQTIAKSHFDYTYLFPKYATIRGGNLIHGQHGETHFSFSYVDLGGGRNEKETIFNGLVLVADFPKKMKGKTVVLPDTAQNSLGTWLGKKVQEFGRRGLDLVYMEDPLFEKAFVVYSSDQIEARYILTPNMMDNLMKLQKEHLGDLSFAFANGKVCVAINYVDQIKSNLSDRINPRRTLDKFFSRIELVTRIIDTLNLNTRIWKKT